MEQLSIDYVNVSSADMFKINFMYIWYGRATQIKIVWLPMTQRPPGVCGLWWKSG